VAGSTYLNDPDDKGFLMMPKTVFEPSIKSRPTYGVLEHRPGTAHLMVADAEGAQALLDLAHSAPPTLWTQAMIVYIPGRSGQQFTQALANLSPSQCTSAQAMPPHNHDCTKFYKQPMRGFRSIWQGPKV
jgi:hypothetical protein